MEDKRKEEKEDFSWLGENQRVVGKGFMGYIVETGVPASEYMPGPDTFSVGGPKTEEPDYVELYRSFGIQAERIQSIYDTAMIDLQRMGTQEWLDFINFPLTEFMEYCRERHPRLEEEGIPFSLAHAAFIDYVAQTRRNHGSLETTEWRDWRDAFDEFAGELAFNGVRYYLL